MRATALCLLLAAGCGDRALFISYEVPAMRARTPYSTLCVDVEVGDTRNATLVVKRTGMLTRTAAIPKDGPVCVRLPRGAWDVQVTGIPGEGAVVAAPGAPKPAVPAGRMPKSWPKKPLEARVNPSFLTWIGHLCAHEGCTAVWQPLEPPEVQPWRDAERVTPFADPTPDEPPAKKDEK